MYTNTIITSTRVIAICLPFELALINLCETHFYWYHLYTKQSLCITNGYSFLKCHEYIKNDAYKTSKKLRVKIRVLGRFFSKFIYTRAHLKVIYFCYFSIVFINWLIIENVFVFYCCARVSYEAAAAGRFLIANRLHLQLLEFIPHVSTNLLSYQPDVIFNYRFYLNFYQKFRGDGKISKLSCIFFDCIKTCKNWVHMYDTGTFQIINKFIHLSNLQQNKFILGKHQIEFFCLANIEFYLDNFLWNRFKAESELDLNLWLFYDFKCMIASGWQDVLKVFKFWHDSVVILVDSI